MQVRTLQRLVAIATAVPRYRARFAAADRGAGEIRYPDDIRRLPILTRSEVQRLGVEGLRVPGSRGMRASTSGSIGSPARFLWPLEQMRWLDAGEARARAWMSGESHGGFPEPWTMMDALRSPS